MIHIPTTTLPFPELASALLPDDVITLSRLSGPSEVWTWTRNRIEECKKQLDALIAIQNSITLIDTLPNELLMKIFASIPAHTWRSSALWMLTMGHICRRWRAVVLATPEFWVKPLEYWTDTENDDGINHLLPIFLERSSPCPLQLYAFGQLSKENYYGWAPHFWRLTALEAYVENEWDAAEILQTITEKMERLVRLKLEVNGFERGSTAESDFHQWKAESFPHLGRLEISSDVFCRATTVPSLHTIILSARGSLKSFPRLLNGLRGCPALAKLYVDFSIWGDIMDDDEDSEPEAPTPPDCLLDLPNIRKLKLAGKAPMIRTFLSLVSFPVSAARVELIVEGTEDDDPAQPPVLPDILPRHLSVLHASPPIDRLFLQSDADGSDVPFVSLRGYVQGAERLRVGFAVWLHSGDRLLELLQAFRAPMVTELALDLRHVASDMDGAFWGRFFAALPGLRRLQLLSCTLESREIKRDLAERFLANTASREPPQAGRAHAISLAWVVRADRKNPSRLHEELGDVRRVVGGHCRAQHGARGCLERLELCGTSLEPIEGSCHPKYYREQAVDVTQVSWDRTSKWLLNRNYVSQLEEAAEVVTADGQLKIRPADAGDGEEDGVQGDEGDRDDSDELAEWYSEEASEDKHREEEGK